MGSVIMGLSEGKIPKREPYATHRYQSKRIQRLKGVAPDAVSIQFAARLIGVHSHTVRRWIKWRFLPAYRVGSINSSNYLRVRRDHLLQVAERKGPDTRSLSSLTSGGLH